MVAIWNTDWVFYNKAGLEIKSENVVTKRIPVEFIISEKLPYKRALSAFTKSTQDDLQIDRQTKLKKFKIIWKKKIGEVSNDERHLEDLYQ